MILGLTGTPGTGKTTVARLIENKGVSVIYLKELADTHDFIDSIDETRNSSIIDVDAVDQYLQKNFDKDDLILIESHLSHVLSIVEQVIVLRCHPKILRSRLQKREWSWEKIRENLEAEMLDVILSEAVDYCGRENVFEIDSTDLSVDCIARDIHQKMMNKKIQYMVKPGSFDWSEFLFDSTIFEENRNGS